MDEYLYRYKYLPYTDGSLKVIDDCTIKFSHPSEFNDPFDCLPIIDVDQLSSFLMKDHDLMKHYKKIYGSTAKVIQNKNRIINDIEKNKEQFVGGMLKNVGVLSLSRTPKSILMWSHYAQNHKGFIAEFKIKLTNNMINLNMLSLIEMFYPFPVEYHPNRPKMTLDNNQNKSLRKGLLTKFDDWKYEEEERIIDLIRGPGIHSYNPQLLNSIITGMMMPTEKRAEIKNKINIFNNKHNCNVEIYECHPINNKFKLQIPNHPRGM